MVEELGSFVEGFKDPTTQTSTPKFGGGSCKIVMQIDKVVELFQTMTIVSLNMGNLILEANSLKNILATWEKEKVMFI